MLLVLAICGFLMIGMSLYDYVQALHYVHPQQSQRRLVISGLVLRMCFEVAVLIGLSFHALGTW